MIRFMFSWVPTITFAFAILGGFMMGFIRGFRKSTILLIHAAGAFLVCLIIYLCLVNSDKLDHNMLKLVNFILSKAGQGSLQSVLNVNEECSSITEILIEFIPKQMGFGDGFQLIMYENGAYLKTIVDLVYHIILALILLIVYVFIVFILYIIYLFAYSERKYKKKKNRAFKNAESEHGYRKRALLGGLVGGLRSAVVAVVGLAFAASLMFILGGGIGSTDYEIYSDVKIEDENLYGIPDVDTYLEIYKNFRSYGNEGIYKILNVVKTKDDVPFYLFAVDIVFQGGLKDDNLGIDENIYFRREIGQYSNFATGAFDLILKHGGAEISAFINGKDTENKQLLDCVVKVMAKEEFQSDFDKLIDEFNENSYFLNFGLSLINSIAANIDEDISLFSSMDPTTKDLLKILFVGENKIKVSDLISKDDIKLLTGLVLKAMAYNQQNPVDESDSLGTILNYGKIILPEISKLSILNDPEKTTRLNSTLKELYDHFYSKLEIGKEEMSKEEASELSSKALLSTQASIDDVDWIKEIRMILESGVDIITIYGALAKSEGDMLTGLFDLLDPDNPDAEANEEAFDNVTKVISDSRLLGVIMASYLNDMIVSMASSISSNIKMPQTYSYSNEYYSDGTISKYGELHNMLKLLKTIAKNDEARAIFTAEAPEDDSTAGIKKYIDVFNVKTDDDKTLLDAALDSEIFEYLISGILFNITFGEYKLYIPDDYIVEGRDEISLVQREEVSNILAGVPVILDTVAEGDLDIDSIVSNEEIKNAIRNSVVIEATMADIIVKTLGSNDSVAIPNRLKTVDNWLEHEDDGEVLNLINALDATDISIDNFDPSSLAITNAMIEEMLKSEILHYTMSKNIINELSETIEIPAEACETIDEETVITKLEITNLIDGVIKLNDAEATGISITDMNITEFSITTTKVDELLESKIAHRLLTDKVDEALESDIPKTAYEDTLCKYIDVDEMHSLVTAASDDTGVINIGGDAQTDFTFDTLNQSKFSAMADSVIVRYKVTNILKDKASEDILVLPNYNGFMENDLADKEYICESEFLDFLNAVYAGYGVDGSIDIGNINISLPDESRFEVLLDSTIIRATITSKIEITADGTVTPVLIDESDLDDNSTDVIIISAFELLRSLKAIKAITNGDGFELTISIQAIAQMNTESIYKIAQSNIIRIIVNDLIRRTPSIGYTDIGSTALPALQVFNGTIDEEVSADMFESNGSIYHIKSVYAQVGTYTLINIDTGLDIETSCYCDVTDGQVLSKPYTLQVYFALYKQLFPIV